MSFFTANTISAGYAGRTIVDHVSFSLEGGSLMGVLGANGCGKTTLIKALCSILPHTGSCRLQGHALEALSPRQVAQLCSYIPQRSGISIDMPVLDVVLMGFNPQLRLLDRPSAAMQRAALDALRCVGLAGMEHKNHLHLSEGQKQLCILARTLVSGAKLFLLDEPESALDFHFRYTMLDVLAARLKAQQCSAIVALHDPLLALNYCDSLLLLHEGRMLDILFPAKDPLPRMEAALSRLYGSVSLHQMQSRSGRTQLVMLREDCP